MDPCWCSSLVFLLFFSLRCSVKFETSNYTSNYSGYARVSDCWSWTINETFKACTVCWRGNSWGFSWIMLIPSMFSYWFTFHLMLVSCTCCIQVSYPTARQQASWSLDDLPRTVAFTMNQGSSITSMDFHPSHRTLLLGMITYTLYTLARTVFNSHGSAPRLAIVGNITWISISDLKGYLIQLVVVTVISHSGK